MDGYRKTDSENTSSTNNSPLFRVVSRLERVTGGIIQYGVSFFAHFYILSLICQPLNIDFLSLPDTLEYQLMLGYLLVIQLVFVDWLCKYLKKALDILVRPIKAIASFAEEKIRQFYGTKDR